MLITNDQIDELVSTLAELSGLDPELVAFSGPLVRAGRYDEAVSRAFVVLEERLRALLGTRGGSGRQLLGKLFNEKDPQYVERLNLPEQEWKGIRDIADGALAAYRNRAAHTVAGFSLDEARGVIHLVNLLLLTLDRIKDAPAQQVPAAMAEVLGPAATDRLNRFLAGLPAIGIVRGKGKQWYPYKARLVYMPENWEEPRPYLVSVFYLTRVESPVLAFRISSLEQVPGLDSGELVDELLQLGCHRVQAKTTPIELSLVEKNDQATFDRLHGMLEELVRKHGG